MVGETAEKKIMKPHICLVRNFWEIRNSREATHPIAMVAAWREEPFKLLAKKGPWHTNEVDRATYVGDAKNPV